MRILSGLALVLMGGCAPKSPVVRQLGRPCQATTQIDGDGYTALLVPAQRFERCVAAARKATRPPGAGTVAWTRSAGCDDWWLWLVPNDRGPAESRVSAVLEADPTRFSCPTNGAAK